MNILNIILIDFTILSLAVYFLDNIDYSDTFLYKIFSCILSNILVVSGTVLTLDFLEICIIDKRIITVIYCILMMIYGVSFTCSIIHNREKTHNRNLKILISLIGLLVIGLSIFPLVFTLKGGTLI